MNKEFNKLIVESVPNQKEANKLMAKLLEIAQPQMVFSEPTTSAGYTVITASELTAGIGYGYGGGAGTAEEDEQEGPGNGAGFGGGGGGGGTTTARPVAAIIIRPDGVQVEPIVDPTKIAIAFFTTIGAMVMAWRKMAKG